ncbi:STAS domain-containing protein [Mangrovitalea sediminis]|uniref:STAS domain-containing protein n=1 Tax=Mangrovitalea sediminis TaxID=1982043 RepID=UPI000BE563F4|nr:STAS domain-containing protein [Mangrovitalea sediminis]
MSTDETIRLDERFDFSYHRTFHESCKVLLERPSVKKITLDLAKTRYMDSSALGMLVQLKKKCDEAGKGVAIVNATGQVRETLEIANIQKLIPLA